MSKTYFISGHLDLTDVEFAEHYGGQILEAVMYGNAFVVGDARGADEKAQNYLRHLQKDYPDLQVIVYHMFDSPRHNAGFETHGGFTTDANRDATMTAASNADIAWVREGRENSGTARNLIRRSKRK